MKLKSKKISKKEPEASSSPEHLPVAITRLQHVFEPLAGTKEGEGGVQVQQLYD